MTINSGKVTLRTGTYNTQYGIAYGFGKGSGTRTNDGPYILTLADASYLDENTSLDPNGT